MTTTVKVYHCVNGKGLFDRQIEFGTHSAYQCKFDSEMETGMDPNSCMDGFAQFVSFVFNVPKMGFAKIASNEYL